MGMDDGKGGEGRGGRVVNIFLLGWELGIGEKRWGD